MRFEEQSANLKSGKYKKKTFSQRPNNFETRFFVNFFQLFKKILSCSRILLYQCDIGYFPGNDGYQNVCINIAKTPEIAPSIPQGQLNHPETVSIVTVMPATSELTVQDKNVRVTEA